MSDPDTGLPTAARVGIRVSGPDPEGDYAAVWEEMPSVSAFGSKPAEALREFCAALDRVLRVLEEEGREIPAPPTKG